MTRYGRAYVWTMTRLGGLPGDCYATVNHINELKVTLHSSTTTPRPTKRILGF